MSGPFPSGGGGWSLPVLGHLPRNRLSLVEERVREEEEEEKEVEEKEEKDDEEEELGDHAPHLLLLAGGTGITGWLPALEVGLRRSATGSDWSTLYV